MITRIWHDNGNITATARGVASGLPTSGTYIDVASFDGEISEWRVVNGVLEQRPDLVDLRKPAALTEITRRMADARRVFITDLPGQDAIYLRKETEARAFQADPTGTYPLIDAEVGITGQDRAEVAAVYLAMAAQWEAVAAQLEAARLTASRAVALAATTQDIDDALTAFETAVSAVTGGA